MKKIRKGSIVWDNVNNCFTKVLTSPEKNEIPDFLMKSTGNATSFAFNDIVLVEDTTGESKFTCRNKPCYIRKLDQLIPKAEYLELRAKIISLSHIEGEVPYKN